MFSVILGVLLIGCALTGYYIYSGNEKLLKSLQVWYYSMFCMILFIAIFGIIGIEKSEASILDAVKNFKNSLPGLQKK